MKKVLAVAALLMGAGGGNPGLVVHEWGTFTSLSAPDGAPFQWRPLNGASDLPRFVYPIPDKEGRRIWLSKDSGLSFVRMETPVVYFYAGRATDVSLKVDFPKGRITEWYPAARNTRYGIDWGRFRVVPGGKFDLPTEKEPSHYYPARETDAAPVELVDPATKAVQHEKFLFYRGVGSFVLPVKAGLEGRRVVLKNQGKEPVAPVIVFENRGGKVGFRVHGSLEGEAKLDRPDLTQEVDAVKEELVRVLRGYGLYEKEARAMVKTWSDTWFEEGLRVFYVMPSRATDEVLPLAVDPKPAEIVRVLVGRTEILTPELERNILDLVEKPAGSDVEMQLKKFGRFAEPVVRRVYYTTADPAVKQRAAQLMVKGLW
jgi:hypothetical protein